MGVLAARHELKHPAMALSAGLGLLAGGLVIALVGHVLVGKASLADSLVAAGLVIAAIGMVAAIVRAIGFAIYGSAKKDGDS